MNKQTANDLNQQSRQIFDQGNYQRAIQYNENAIVLARDEKNTDEELWALSQLSSAWYNLGDYQKSIEVSTRLLALARQEQNESYKIDAICGLAVSLGGLDLRGRWHELKPLLLEGLHAARQIESLYFILYCLIRLGRYAVRIGELDQGFSWLQEALNILQQHEVNHKLAFLGDAYASLSLLMRKKGLLSEAIRYAELSLGVRQQDGQPQFIAYAQLTLAEAKQAQGERAEALQLVETVCIQAQHMHWKIDEQEASYLKGELERELGHPQEALPAAQRALELAQEMMEKEEEVEALLSVGQILLALQQREQGQETLRQARRLSQERDYEDHFQKAESLLQGVV